MARGTRDDEETPILPWRLVIGIFLHFAIPLYLIALLAAFLFLPGVPATAEARVRWLLRESGLFLVCFAAATTLAGIVAAMIDPPLRALRRRRRARDPDQPAIASRRRAQAALGRLGAADWGNSGARVTAAVERLSLETWDHHSVEGQRLSQDLAEAANAFTAALESARGTRRGELATLAAGAIDRIADALEQQHADKSRLDEGDARTIARLIDLRYGGNSRPVSLDRPQDEE
jgi:hypothetical protein